MLPTLSYSTVKRLCHRRNGHGDEIRILFLPWFVNVCSYDFSFVTSFFPTTILLLDFISWLDYLKTCLQLLLESIQHVHCIIFLTLYICIIAWLKKILKDQKLCKYNVYKLYKKKINNQRLPMICHKNFRFTYFSVERQIGWWITTFWVTRRDVNIMFKCDNSFVTLYTESKIILSQVTMHFSMKVNALLQVCNSCLRVMWKL